MTPDTVNKLEQAFANGATDIQACFYAGISKQTLYTYQDKHPEFIDRKEALKQNLNLIAKNTIARAIKDGDTQEAKWWLERREKEAFSLRNENRQVDENGKTAPLQIELTKTIRNAKDND